MFDRGALISYMPPYGMNQVLLMPGRGQLEVLLEKWPNRDTPYRSKNSPLPRWDSPADVHFGPIMALDGNNLWVLQPGSGSTLALL